MTIDDTPDDRRIPRKRAAFAGFARLAAAALLTAALAGCGMSTEDLTLGLIEDEPDSSTPPVADGVYVVQNGKRGRLDEEPQKVLKTWDLRTNLPRNLQFLVIHDSVATTAPDADAVLLQKVARVRNNIEPNGTVRKPGKSEWVIAYLPGFEIPVTVTRQENSPRLLRVTPAQPLEPGLYSLTYRTGHSRIGGRFGVEWKTADKTQYAAQYCVDRYMSNPAFYRPCSDRQTEETAARQIGANSVPIKVHSLKIRRDVIGGQPALVLDGKLTNSSASIQRPPLLLAVINDKAGKELTRWTFQPNAQQIPPGGTLGFSTTANTPPKGAAGVTVTPVEGRQASPPTQPQPEPQAQPGVIETQPLDDVFMPDEQLSAQ
jgi:hypothetical protein